VLRSLFARWVPAIVRHLEAWAEVAGEDLHDAATRLARRLGLILVAAAAAFFALLMLCTWLLVLAWDGPWRAWVAGGLALGFAALAAGLAWPAVRGASKPKDAFFARVRAGLARDRELLERSFNGNGKGRPAASQDDDRAAG